MSGALWRAAAFNRSAGALWMAAVGVFDTEDARRGIESFLTSGPGHATFAGR